MTNAAASARSLESIVSIQTQEIETGLSIDTGWHCIQLEGLIGPAILERDRARFMRYFFRPKDAVCKEEEEPACIFRRLSPGRATDRGQNMSFLQPPPGNDASWQEQSGSHQCCCVCAWHRVARCCRSEISLLDFTCVPVKLILSLLATLLHFAPSAQRTLPFFLPRCRRRRNIPCTENVRSHLQRECKLMRTGRISSPCTKAESGSRRRRRGNDLLFSKTISCKVKITLC